MIPKDTKTSEIAGRKDGGRKILRRCLRMTVLRVGAGSSDACGSNQLMAAAVQQERSARGYSNGYDDVP